MATNTTNFGLTKPGINDPADKDLWGTQINGDIDNIDTVLKAALDFTPVSKTITFSVTAPTAASATIGDSKKFYLCDATSGAITANLPASASSSGMVIAVKKTDASANAVTLDGNASETIDGATTLVLSTQNEYVVIANNGSAWYVIARSACTDGTFVPAITSAGGGAATYSAQVGTYIKTPVPSGGSKIDFQARVSLATKGTLGAGIITVTGLPATSNATANTNWSVVVYGASLAATADKSLVGFIGVNSTSISVWRFGAGTATQLTVADLAGTDQFIISGSYRAQ